jgi:predicted DNA binding protein
VAGGGDFEAFDAALDADPTVEEVVTATEYDEEKFYQVNWSEDLKRDVDAALDREGFVLHAETRSGDWHLTIRFTTRDQFEVFRQYLAEHEISFRLENLTRATSPQQFMGGLTAPQRDALVAGVEKGYFAIPREATMADVADALGISTQSASERLRRGIEPVTETMLLVDGDPAEERRGT